MNDEPSIDHVEARRRWFEAYIKTLARNSIIAEPRPGFSYRCPCCGFKTLDSRGGFEICEVCFWEDDGQDDHDAETIRGGPNGALSLAVARRNFARIGACELRSKDHVRAPRPEER